MQLFFITLGGRNNCRTKDGLWITFDGGREPGRTINLIGCPEERVEKGPVQ